MYEKTSTQNILAMSSSTINRFSEKLLLALKIEQDSSELRLQLEGYDMAQLKKDLHNDENKTAFWVNIYNSYFLILRKERKMEKPDIYKKKLFTIAGEQLSLDDVEHGILRKGQYKEGQAPEGKNLDVIKELMVETLDHRIHFALNCGAKSCPPIAFYKAESIGSQLDMATQAFLEGESDFDDVAKEVHTTILLDWFSSDFGGTEGIKELFKNQIEKDISDFTIKFKEYSWEEDLNNFASLSFKS